MRRRAWLLSGVAAGGALLVGWSVLPPRGRLGAPERLGTTRDAVALNGWIRITVDGRVELAMNRSEMGQGVHTALPMLVAEELDVPLDRVVPVPAGHDALYGNVAAFVGSLLPVHPRDEQPGAETARVRVGRWMVSKVARELGINMTGGSSSVADAWEVLRLAAATARAQLLGAASLAWKLPVAEFAVVDGVIEHAASGQRAAYAVFARAAAITPPGEVRLKPAAAWRLIGTSAPRTDLPAKCDGRARYGIDLRLPDQLFAVVRHAPMLGGWPGRIDGIDEVLRRPGVVRVLRLPPYAGGHAAVAVVGRSVWHARQGAEALRIDWRAPPAGGPDSAAIADRLARAAREGGEQGGGVAFHSRGDVDGDAARGVREFAAAYRTPYLAHAAMEPLNATAQVRDGRIEVWVPTQVPGLARALAARVAGVAPEAVTVHVTLLGGGFGRRLDTEVVGQAVRIAQECQGRPVQLVWPREEDMTHDVYRPAGAAWMTARLDARGQPVSIRWTSAGDAISPRWMERNLPALAGPVDTPDKTTGEGLFDSPYAFPHQRIAHVATRSGVPVGFWRSVGHSHNAFFKEAFVDELAAEAGQDPVAFRLAWLRELPRHAEVLKRVADEAGWPGFRGGGKPLPAGRARGVALHESFGSIVAMVVEASLDEDGPRVHRVVVAADVGTVVNPGIVRQQLEGGVVFGLTAALHGRIDIVGGAVQQTNYPAYRLLPLARTPRIEVHLLASERPPAGVGEPGVPPVAPALANALHALTGRRWRELPLMPPPAAPPAGGGAGVPPLSAAPR
ncbi:xanthine dehydrogenase family protein molybdopterin-binding subunit [Piscinibacter sakaiensis]|uniref:Isoquinoline 1-oxidoreductase, beta subunit n=1 Tax=Piscinibacter sakaiensis TaxID=1547922 RepID=A0A0K8P7W0_PISS1|nr:molybdopterin cofactor-binding domain-containing protein [Piscinibacter sakaiensis]GAP38614.1 isoquinoline 1-oxidoreductase, beta subunit [Piscinibacter sakaiensis]